MSNGYKMVLVLALAACLAGAARAQQPPAVTPPPIAVDDELNHFFADAQQAAAAGQYGQAIQILQAMLERPEQTFVPGSEPNQYLSLALRARAVLGQLPPEALTMYRNLYDGAAKTLFEHAAAEGDMAALGQIARRFGHTSYGARSLDELGRWSFDAGQFAQAARYWTESLALAGPDDANRARLLVQVAAAAHLAGLNTAAQVARAQLDRDYPGKTLPLAGREQPAGEFLDRLFARAGTTTAPAATSTAPATASASAQEDCTELPALSNPPSRPAVQPLLYAQWTQPDMPVEANPNVLALTSSQMLAPVVITASGKPVTAVSAGPAGKNRRIVLEQKDGHIQQAVRPREGASEEETFTFLMPPVLHPLVVGEAVIVRETENIVAYNIADGRPLWASHNFPLYRPTSPPPGGYYMGPVGQNYAERLDMAISAGEGRIYAVGLGLPPFLRFAAMQQGRNNNRRETVSSALAAFSIAEQGRMLWQVGRGQGENELLRQAEYLPGPVYRDGRVYVLAQHVQNLHVLALAADTGKLLWSARVCSLPSSQSWPDVESRFRPAGPVVADGRVFVATNVGVVAAYDADVGSPLWAYSYMAQRDLTAPPIRAGTRQWPLASANLPLVEGERLIVMPQDAAALMALSVEDGRRLWNVKRTQRDLMPIDAGRALLSGPGLRVVELEQGKEVLQANLGEDDILGQPAVAGPAVLASGRGRVVRWDMADNSVTSLPLLHEDALGNLLAIRGRLIAANAAGVAMYQSVDQAVASATRGLEGAKGQDWAAAMTQRGRMNFYAGRLSQAHDDLLAAQAEAAKLPQAGDAAEAKALLARVKIALADQAAPEKRLELYQQAQGLLDQDRQKAEGLLRMALAQEALGQYEKAAALYVQVGGQYAKTPLAAVRSGPEADRLVRDDVPATSEGYRLGNQRLRELIVAHGRSAVREMDELAQAVMKRAAAQGSVSALLDMAHQYPCSLAASMALFRAAEMTFALARQADTEIRLRALAQAAKLLWLVMRDYKDSGLAPSAQFGLAMVYRQAGQMMHRLVAENLAQLPPGTPVNFGGLSGTLETLRGQWQYVAQTPTTAAAPPVNLPANLVEVARWPHPARLLTDDTGSALVRDGRVYAVSEGQVVCLDISGPQCRPLWQAKIVRSDNNTELGIADWTAMIGGLSRNGNVLVLTWQDVAVGMDARSGKTLWRNTISSANGISTEDEYIMLGHGSDILAMDKTTGRLVWQHRLVGEPPLLAAPQRKANLLLVLHGAQRAYLSVFDVQKRRLLGRREVARTAVDARLNGEGLLLLPNGRNLELLDPLMSLDEPIWTLPLEKSSHLVGLDENRFVLAVPAADGTKLEVRSLLDCSRVLDTFLCLSQPRPPVDEGGVPASVGMPGQRSVLGVAPAVALYKDKLYALCPSVLQCFTAGRPSPVWTAPLPVQAPMGGVAALGERYVEVSFGVRPLLWEAATGRPVTLAGAPKAGQNEPPYLWWPVYRDRLIVAGQEGVVIYGPGKSAASGAASRPAGPAARPQNN